MKQAILCVDDEAIILLSLQLELKQALGSEYLVETAMNADEARSLMDELAQDGIGLAAIISDWLMPGQRGDEFLGETRTRYPDTVRILVSGMADPGKIDAARRLGSIDACLAKPWSSDKLVATLRQLLGSKHR